jgi:2-dehydropantoate 2-reductase
VDAIRRDGLRVRSGDSLRIVHLPAHIHLEGRADVILLTVKSQDVRESVRDIERARVGATIVTMQNGVRCDLEAAEIVGRDRVIGCVIYQSVSFLQAGEVEEFGSGRLLVGTPFPEATPGLSPVVEILRKVMRTIEVSDFEAARWTKLVPNLGNAIMAITGLPVGKAYRHPGLSKLAVETMQEGVRAIQADGHHFDDTSIGRRFRLLGWLPSPLARMMFIRGLRAAFPPDSPFGSSTQQSLVRGSGSELDYLNGEVVRCGERAGVRTPLNGGLLEIGAEVFQRRQTLSADELVKRLPLR